MRKGEQTRASIVAAALELAARDGLEGLTIGALAERMQMSKSGVFAHFGSREDLQIAVLKEYERRFVQEVLVPGLKAPRGLARLRAILARWLDRTAIEAASGCIWISGATEYDDRPGAVREELVGTVRGWQRELSRGHRHRPGRMPPTVEHRALAAALVRPAAELLEEVGRACLGASIAQPSGPVQVHRTTARAALATGRHPVDAGQIEFGQPAQQRLAR